MALYAAAGHEDCVEEERQPRLQKALNLLEPLFKKESLSPDFRGKVAFHLSYVAEKLGQPMKTIEGCCIAAALKPEKAADAVLHRAAMWESIGDFSNALLDMQQLVAAGDEDQQKHADRLCKKRTRLDARKILQLDSTASKTQIRKACRRMLYEHSPDRVQDERTKKERTLRVCTIAAAQDQLI